MLYRRNEYTVFLSYFGTYSPLGSKGLAMQAKAVIDKTVGGKSYCGPDEDDHTFLQHMDEVIPSTSLFLLVINDSCPQSPNGAISPQSIYMIKEIEAFVSLVRQGERSPKDFAVLYVGNLISDFAQKFTFAQTLLQEVDPERLLSTGNHHFIQDFTTLPAWAELRLKSPVQDTSLSEDQSITFLHDATETFLETRKKGLLLVEMGEGMGKSTYVRQQEQQFFSSPAMKAFFFYFNTKNNYSQLVDFALELYQKIAEGLEQKEKRVLRHLDTFQSDMGKAFTDFINHVKSLVYPDKKLVLFLDGIDFLGSINGKTVLDYLQGIENWAEGIYVVATKRSAFSSQAVINLKVLDHLVQTLTIRKSETRYRRFLKQYFHTHISPKLETLGIEPIKAIFEAISPQTILMFSLYHRILSIYITEHQGSSGCYDDVKDVDAIISYYFKVLQTRYSQNTFLDYKRMLYLLAISSTPLDQEDIHYLISKRILESNYLDESGPTNYLFRVFTTTYVEKGEVYYTLIHDSIRRLLNFDWQLIDAVNAKLYDHLFSAVKRNEKNLELLFSEGKTLLRFAKPLLTSDAIEDEEKEDLLKSLTGLPFEPGWGKAPEFRLCEEQVIRMIVESDSDAIPALRKAYCLTVLGNDLYIDGKIAECDIILRRAVDIYDAVRIENLSDADQYEYQELKSLVSTCAQALGDSETAVSAYEQLVRVLKALYEKGYPKADKKKYVRNIACLGHVYGHAKRYQNQISTLEKAERLCLALGVEDINITTFILFGKAYYYYDTADYPKAFEVASKTIENYLSIHEDTSQQFYYGNILDCTRLRFEIILAYEPLQNGRTVDKVIRQYRLLQQMQRQDGEYNYLYNIAADEALAKLQFKVEKRKEAIMLCARIVELIETNKLDIDDEYFMGVKQRVIELEKEMGGNKDYDSAGTH